MKKFWLFFFLFSSVLANATHNRAGEITYSHVSGLTYEFTFTIYADPTSNAFQRRLIEVDWGDNTGKDSIIQTRVVPIASNVSRRDFVSTHTFSTPGNFRISVTDPNRNGGIDNISGSIGVPFYVETLLRISPFGSFTNSSPVLLNPPIDDACVGELFLHNPGAYDPDGDSLAYQIARSKGLNGTIAPGFEFPPATNSISVNANNGDLIWDVPSQSGTYNVAIKIQEYRNGVLIGEVVRDMQIEVVPGCNNRPPVIFADELVCIEAGRRLKSPIEGIDPDGDPVSLEVSGEPFLISQNPAQFSSTQAMNPNRDTLYWNTICEHVRIKPYRVSIKAIDDASARGTISLTAFKTKDIRVIAPAPTNFTATDIRDEIRLNWNNAACLNASGYHVYRRVDSSGFVPNDCEVGVPSSTGFQRIATLEGRGNSNYIDNDEGNGLAPGVKYCYLVTAYFEDGDESYASEEVCATVKKFIPLITNVSINSTDQQNGELFLAWSPPDSIDQSAFPPPYKFLIYSENEGQRILIDSTLSINDTSIVFNQLNTLEESFTYEVELYSQTFSAIVGKSPSASSIYINAFPSDNQISLSWANEVSWLVDSFIVYRKVLGEVNFDSIGVANQSQFVDTGLSNSLTYCYRVESRGRYQLNTVKFPLVNFSQEVCSTPVDETPPCTPLYTIAADCDSNYIEIRWEDSALSCVSDIVNYRVYRSSTLDGEFELLQETTVNEAKLYGTNLTSIAGCYGVSSIDSVGNESNIVRSCVDYCPRYELPNIFTPNGDGINDLFVPFPNYRYVDSIELSIYNRWGTMVFETNDPDILWDAVDMNTNETVTEGVYFYSCIIFELSLEGIVPRVLKGTVNVQAPNGFKKVE